MTPVWEPLTWDEAVSLIQLGFIVQIDQSHSGTVKLVDSAGKRYICEEPRLGNVLEIVRRLDPEIGQKIAISME